MKKLKYIFKNLSFRYKIAYISLGISLIPIILLGSFIYAQTRRLLIEREETALKGTLNQEVANLDYKIKSYFAAMDYIIWDENIRTGLSKTYKDNYDMYLTYENIIDPLFLTIRSLHSTIDSITVYTDNPIYPHGNVLRPLSDIINAKWYNNALKKTQPFFIISDNKKSLYMICRMYNKNSTYTNIFRITINTNSLFQTSEKLLDESYGFILLNQNNEVIFQYSNFNELKYRNISAEQLINTENSQKNIAKNFVIEHSSLTSVPWRVVLYRPIKAISNSAKQITVTVYIFILLCMAIVLISSTLLSKVVVRPIMDLSKNMTLIEQGDLEVTVEYNSKDEIGQLICTFRKMVEQLKYLIEEVLKSKIAQKEYEMKALQAQINPHFLYNCLSLINGKAIMSGQDDISQMAQLLSTFYRTTLNKGKDLISVKDELQNTISYAKIQQLMHSYSFDIVYDIDDSVYSYIMPHLLLQPLVENAIVHGIDHKESPDKGILTIYAHHNKNSLIFKILDNGCGMTKEQCDNIITSESNGYGIRNVHQRIQLIYGPEYGLQYSSTKGLGTCVTLTIGKNPKRPIE